MADRFKIKFTIEAVDRFSTTMNRLERKLDSLQRKADKFDLNMKADADLNVDEALDRISILEERANRLSQQIERRKTLNVDTSDASNRIEVLERGLTVIGDRRLVRIDADTNRASNSLRVLRTAVSNTAEGMRDDIERAIVPRNDYEVRADFTPVLREAERARIYMGEIFESQRLRIEADVDADTGEASSRLSIWQRIMNAAMRLEARMHLNDGSMASVTARILAWRAAMQTNVFVDIMFRNYSNFRRRAANLATNLRNMGEIFQGMGTGLILTFSSILSPLIASTTGMIGSLGVMLGTTAGATMGLASSFFGAGAAAVGFGAVATPVLTDLFTHMEDLEKVTEKHNAALRSGDVEKAAELMKEYERILGSMTEEQVAAMEAVETFKGIFQSLTDALEPGILNAFTSSLTALADIIAYARPMIEKSVDTVNDLMDALNRNLESEDVQAFFEYLNTTAAESLDVIVRALGNFMMGIFNLMAAFSPLATDMQNGFLEMSEGFREWTAALGESEKFQAFVEYVRENWSKVRGIVGGAIAALIETFAGFSDYASGWMDTVLELVGKWREFAQGMGENEKFQEFVQFMKDNAPAVTQFLGNIVQAIVELGIAMAPVGVYMLNVANAILEWLIGFRQAHPVISNVAMAVMAFIGVVITLFAPILLAVSVFTAFGQSLLVVGKFILGLIPSFTTLGQFLTHLGGIFKSLIGTIGRVAMSFIRFMGPIGLVISIVIALAVAIYQNWGTIGPWISNLFSTIGAFFQEWWTWARSYFGEAIAGIAEGISTGFSAIASFFSSIFATIWAGLTHFWNGLWELIVQSVGLARDGVVNGFNAIASFISSIMSAIGSFLSSAWSAIQSTFSSAVSAVQGFVESGFSAVQSFIENAISNAQSFISNAWDTITSTFDAGVALVESLVDAGFNAAADAIDAALGVAIGFVEGAIDTITGLFDIDLYDAGYNIISTVASGIGGAVSLVTGAIGSVTSAVRRFLPFSPAKEGALRDLDKLNFGGTIADSITSQTGAVRRAMNTMMYAARPEVDFAVNNAYTGAGRAYSQARSSQARERAQASQRIEVPVYLNGREIARATTDETTRLQERNKTVSDKFAGRRRSI